MVYHNPEHKVEHPSQTDHTADAGGNSSLRYIDLMLSNNKAEIFKTGDNTAVLQPFELSNQVLSSVRGTDFLNPSSKIDPHVDRTAFLTKPAAKPLAARWDGLPA